MEKECAHCSERFLAKRKSRLYCSDNCKQLAYYKRNGLVLQGNRSQYTAFEGHSIEKDVKVSSVRPESFIARLNALIEEEVQRRLVQRVSTDDFVNQNGTVKSCFTESENSIFAVQDNAGDNHNANYSHEVNVKDDIGTTTKSVESFTQTEDTHLEPIGFSDDYEPIDDNNDVRVKDNIGITSESIASFTESKAKIESAENIDYSIPDAAIYSDIQSPETLNVKHEPKASFTVTVNNGEQDLDNDEEFEKALAALDNFPISGIEISEYQEEQSVPSTATASFLSQTPLDSSQPFNVIDSVVANDNKEKISAILASLQAVDRTVVQPIRESSQQDSLLKPEDISEFNPVHSTFIEQINKHPRRADTEFLRYRSSPDQCKILMVTKSLLRHLMLFTLCAKVTRHAVVELSNGFYKMVNSEEFSSLPKSFPYQETIVQLHKQIRSIAEKATRTPAPLRISRAQRARVFALLTEMKSTVKGVEFSKLTITCTHQ